MDELVSPTTRIVSTSSAIFSIVKRSPEALIATIPITLTIPTIIVTLVKIAKISIEIGILIIS
jgi:hypothetical protein